MDPRQFHVVKLLPGSQQVPKTDPDLPVAPNRPRLRKPRVLMESPQKRLVSTDSNDRENKTSLKENIDRLVKQLDRLKEKKWEVPKQDELWRMKKANLDKVKPRVYNNMDMTKPPEVHPFLENNNHFYSQVMFSLGISAKASTVDRVYNEDEVEVDPAIKNQIIA